MHTFCMILLSRCCQVFIDMVRLTHIFGIMSLVTNKAAAEMFFVYCIYTLKFSEVQAPYMFIWKGFAQLDLGLHMEHISITNFVLILAESFDPWW